MEKLFHVIFTLLFFQLHFGQNLVPNGDFEQYDTCPTNEAQLSNAIPWINPSTNIAGSSGTPDYFNSCNGSLMGVPYNWLGFQEAHSGNGYAGIFLYQPSGDLNIREYLEVQLTHPLVAQKSYHFELYFNLGDLSRYTVDNIGVYFSDTIISGIDNFSPLPVVPQINNTIESYPDTTIWKLLSGEYTSYGNEQYIIIGCFVSDLISQPVTLNNTGNYFSYIMIDDVSLTLSTAEIKNLINEVEIEITPNPFLDKIELINNELQIGELKLYDLTGELIIYQAFFSIRNN
jgi:hypothetical protein